MKRTILAFAGLLMLVGCDAHHAQTASSIGFVGGARRDDVIHQLEQVHSTLLTNTPEFVRAEFKMPEMKRAMQVELAFHDGLLAGVNYIPQ